MKSLTVICICAIATFLLHGTAKSYEITFSYPTLKIVNGHEARPHSAPYVVLLKVTAVNGNGEVRAHFCGGTLISRDFVLTAKHCVERAIYAELSFGKHNKTTHEQGEHITYSSGFISHEWADIALIKLVAPIDPRPNITTISLPSQKNMNRTYSGQNVTAYGWGLTGTYLSSNVLMTEDLEIMPWHECSNFYRNYHLEIFDHEFCTSGMNHSGTCGGDSGGPLVLNQTQIGIIARGSTNCSAGMPSIHLNISYFGSWIQRNTGIIIN